MKDHLLKWCAGSLQVDFRQEEGRKLTLGFKIELGCIFAVVFGGLVYWWVKVRRIYN